MRSRLTISNLIGRLDADLEDSKVTLDSYENNILRLREFIGEIDAKLGMVMKTESEDLHADIEEIHQFICNEKPALPYNMRR